jgi:septal ring factor EnvC (AmiA/AmiB activator)
MMLDAFTLLVMRMQS